MYHANITYPPPSTNINKQIYLCFPIHLDVHTMRSPQVLIAKPSASLVVRKWSGNSNSKGRPYLGNRGFELWRPTVKNQGFKAFGSIPTNSFVPVATVSDIGSGSGSGAGVEAGVLQVSSGWEPWEELIERVIYGCRFLTFMGVLGSLVGSFLCFIKGCAYVVASFREYFASQGQVIVSLILVEAIDIYLLGTVMLVFGMGLYELFVSNLDIATSDAKRSNLFGLFTLKERPKWLDIKSINELKTKLGHVIVMVLLVGLLEKSRKVEIASTGDLLCFSASILVSAGCLYLLSKLTD